MEENPITEKAKRLLALEIIILIAIVILGYRAYIFLSKNGMEISPEQPFGVAQIPATANGGTVVLDANAAKLDSAQTELKNIGFNLSKSSYNGKALHTFKYSYSDGQILKVSGTCKDSYYAILIFRASDDFSKNPGAAKYNRASECPLSKKFTDEINLKAINLTEGNYYFLVADQGESGPWYNPR